MLAATVSVTAANNGALVRSELGQPLTSSTLQWVSIDGYRHEIPDDAVQGGLVNGQKSYICRIRRSGRQEIGSSDGITCRIVSYVRIVDEQNFQVLVNSNDAGRIVWSAWDRSKTSFFRAVQNGDYFIGRRLGEHGNTYVGHLDPSRRGSIHTIDEQDIIHESSQGEILMEMEAKYYEMGPLKTSLSRRKVQSSEQIVLAHTTLDNMEASGPQTVATTLSYVVNHNIYFSSIRNMVKGLPTTVDSSEEGEKISFLWGSPSISGSFTRMVDASHRLEHGTGVNVSVTARRVTFDAPFNAKLATGYSDDHSATRTVDGNARQTLIEDIGVDVGNVYFLNNGSLVPVTTTTTTSTTTTTTTTTEAPMTSTAPQFSDPQHVTAQTSVRSKETLQLTSHTQSGSSSSGRGLAQTGVLLAMAVMILILH